MEQLKQLMKKSGKLLIKLIRRYEILKQELHNMADARRNKTIEESQITDIMNDKEPRPPEDWNSDDSDKDDSNTKHR